ncbi:hypothetical protein M0R45_014357 [Rubus argutus]|uniref:Uncharacterized protein n=1 Tax=Rubus argutus TaxID=59490 RepID=A0AAW1XMD4_RUBAR
MARSKSPPSDLRRTSLRLRRSDRRRRPSTAGERRYPYGPVLVLLPKRRGARADGESCWGKELYQNSSNGNGSAKVESSPENDVVECCHKQRAQISEHFLHRSSKSLSSSSSCSEASLSLPLLKDSDCESVSISSRLSLSSSSSGHEHEDLPRLSLDSDKPNPNPNPMFSLHRNPKPARGKTAGKIREIKQRAAADQAARVGRSPMRRPVAESATVATSRGVSYRGMERSYSANVRVTPVLNVPVCSLRGSSKSGFGFGQLFSSPQKKKTPTAPFSGKSQHSHYVQQSQTHNKNRTDRN